MSESKEHGPKEHPAEDYLREAREKRAGEFREGALPMMHYGQLFPRGTALIPLKIELPAPVLQELERWAQERRDTVETLVFNIVMGQLRRHREEEQT